MHLPPNEKGKLDVAGVVGREGTIYIIKDLGLKEPYRGSTPIISGELAEDFTYYFAKSEQVPSAVALGVLVDVDNSVKVAGGFILQLLPGLSDDEITELEEKLSAIPPVTNMLERGLTLEQIVSELVGDQGSGQYQEMTLQFRCQCSRERVEQTLISLGRKEISAMIEDDEGAEVVCHFCNEKYHFDRDDLNQILDKCSSMINLTELN